MLVFLDTETTGLDVFSGHELLSIAVITEWPDGRIERWESLIKPERLDLASEKALQINGYCDAIWAMAPTFDEVAPEILSRLEYGDGKMLVGHNVQFDVTFIRESLKRKGYEHRLAYPMIDTITLAHEHLQPIGLRSMKLDNIRKLMGWSMEGAHTALADTETTRRLYHTLIRRSWWDR